MSGNFVAIEQRVADAERRLEHAEKDLARAYFAVEENPTRASEIALMSAKRVAKEALAIWEEWTLD